MKILLSLIILFIPISILAKQICLAPSGCSIEIDTGFCPKCIEVKEEPPIITKEEPPIISKDSTATTFYPRVNESFRKPNKKNWVGTLFKCIVGCKEGVKYWDDGGNEFDKNLNLISKN